jgi:hypothetical protein
MLYGLLAFFFAATVAANLLRCTDCSNQSVSTDVVPSTTSAVEAVPPRAPVASSVDRDDLAVAATITTTTEATTTSSTEAADDSSVSDTDGSVTEARAGADAVEDEDSDSTGTADEVPTTVGPPATPSDQAATEVYVDPESGSDANDGATAETALKSFQTALNRAAPNQTILLMSGIYDELRSPGDLHYYLGRSGQPDAWIRIKAAPGHNPKLVASRGTALFVAGSYVEVSGLTIQGSGFSADNSWARASVAPACIT